jgi:hypothetical protein
MKASVLHIDRPWRWSGSCVEPVSIGLLWWTIVSVTTRVMKSARSLKIFSLCLLLCFILSSNHGLFVVGGQTSLAKYFSHIQREIVLCWLLQITLQSRPRQFLWRIWHTGNWLFEHIILQFGIPQTLTTDEGTTFASKEVREFAALYKIKLLNSSLY